MNPAPTQQPLPGQSKNGASPSPRTGAKARLLFVSLGLALAAVTVSIYWPVVGFEFVNYDDPDYVTQNGYVREGFTREGVAWAFGRIHGAATYWHPLTWLSHMLDCALFGVQPGPQHAVNVLFHIANALLLFAVLRRLTGALWPGAMVAALFALHPLQVGTVAWISERKNVLSTLFWLLTLWAYSRYAECKVQGPKFQVQGSGFNALKWYGLALMFFALGLMSKPMLVTLPFVLLLLDWWPLGRLPSSALNFQLSILWRLLREKLPFFALALVSSAITVLAHRGLGIDNAAFGLPLRLRLENAAVSYAQYLGKTFWPRDFSVLYPHPGVWPVWQVVGSAALILAITVGVVRSVRRRPHLAVGWFWFLGVLVPTIGLIQSGVQAMADRFMYVPAIGLFLMLAWGVDELARRWGNQIQLVRLVAGVCLVVVGIGSAIQLRHWRDSVALFTHATEVTEKNFVAHNNLAYTLAALGRYDEAEVQLTEALRIKPDYAEAHCQMGEILQRRDHLGEAVAHYRQAVRLKPNWLLARQGLADALVAQGNAEEAIEEYLAVLKLVPHDADSHHQVALLAAGQMKADVALAHYREALRLRPDWPEVLNNLAWLLATHPHAQFRDGAEAVRLAERACELTGRRQAILIGTLAAAYAEAGRFSDAVRTAQEARQHALASGEPELAQTNQKLLELYRAEKPYHQAP